ncbi:MAG: 4Fe-4S dicluster domain-containing protein [Proteobacteria bacterium]|nr:4Fe-4S dicluster domain-containing protein [Pseudomonadota bacterium]
MSIRYRLDVSRCIGCRACEVACVTANDLHPERSRNWVPHLQEDASPRGLAVFAPNMCAHCEDPPCVSTCPSGASFQAEDGRVLVDEELCIGCGLCVPSCPYEARYVEPTTNKVEKCTLCDGRVQAGQKPACFDVCPAGARHFVEGAVQVGDVDVVDEGHTTMSLVNDEVNPKPRLVLSGRPADLELVRLARPPRTASTIPGLFWRNGGGIMMQGLGAASAVAMAGMVGLQFLRRRIQNVQKQERSQ